MTLGKGILLFALFMIAGAILCLWGMKKSETQASDLAHNLLNSCANRVIKYLKRHETVSVKEVSQLIDGAVAGQFWSRKKLKVQDPKKFSKQVVDFLVEQQYIEPADKESYRLKK